VEQAQVQAQNAQYQLEDQRQQVALQVRQAYLDYRNAVQQARAQVTQAKVQLLQAREQAGAARREALETLARLMMPMTPHLAEEVWADLGCDDLISAAAWPQADPALLVEDTVTLPIQINGKRRAEIAVAADAAVPDIEAAVLADSKVQGYLEGRTPRKLIVVPGRIVNVVL